MCYGGSLEKLSPLQVTWFVHQLRVDLKYTLSGLFILLFIYLHVLASGGTNRFLLAALLFHSIIHVIDLGKYSIHAKKPSQRAVMMCIVVSMKTW